MNDTHDSVRVISAARSVLAAIVIAAADGRVEEAAAAFRNLSRARVNGDESILDRLMLEEPVL